MSNNIFDKNFCIISIPRHVSVKMQPVCDKYLLEPTMQSSTARI